MAPALLFFLDFWPVAVEPLEPVELVGTAVLVAEVGCGRAVDSGPAIGKIFISWGTKDVNKGIMYYLPLQALG
jgi:hypothetical protein